MSKLLIIAIVIAIGCASVGGAYWYFEEYDKDDEEKKNNAPYAVITSPTEGVKYKIEKEIVFDASASYDEDEDELTYEWNSNLDGILGNEDYFQKKLTKTGLHTITLNVKDQEDESIAQVNITIVGEENHPPIAVIDSPEEGKIFQTTESILFDASNSSDEDIDKYTWTSSIMGKIKEDSKKFSTVLEKGEHKITLEVIDEKGEVGKAYVNITVKEAGTNHAPKLFDCKVDPESGTTEDTYTFSVLYKDEDNDEPQWIKVKIDNNKYDMEKESGDNYINGVKYKYEISGEDLGENDHEFQFSTSDGIDEVIGDKHDGPEVRSENELYAEITASTNDTDTHSRIYFSGNESTGDIENWTWEFDDGNVSYDENWTYHSYNRSDIYTVTLIIRSNSDESTDSIEIKVRNSDYTFESSGNLYAAGSRNDTFEIQETGALDPPTINASWNITNNDPTSQANVTINLYNAEGKNIFTQTFNVPYGNANTVRINKLVDSSEVQNFGNYAIETVSNRTSNLNVGYEMVVIVHY